MEKTDINVQTDPSLEKDATENAQTDLNKFNRKILKSQPEIKVWSMSTNVNSTETKRTTNKQYKNTVVNNKNNVVNNKNGQRRPNRQNIDMNIEKKTKYNKSNRRNFVRTMPRQNSYCYNENSGHQEQSYDENKLSIHNQSFYHPEVFCKDFRVTFVSCVFGIHLQSPEQRYQHESLKKRLKKYWFKDQPKPVTAISEDQDMIYCAYSDGDVFRSRIIRNFDSQQCYLCSDIDTGRLFRVRLSDIYELSTVLREAPPLSIFRALKGLKNPSSSRLEKAEKDKIHAYISKMLKGKPLTVQNPSNHHVDIYYMNDHMNSILIKGVEALFTEPSRSNSSGSSPMSDYYRGSDRDGGSKFLSEIPTSRKMDSLRKSMYGEDYSSHGERSNDYSQKTRNDFLPMMNLVSKNYERRELISKNIAENSVLSKASEYILKNSSFYAEVDDLLSKGRELLMRGTRYYNRFDENKKDKMLTNFHVKRSLINMPETEATLKSFYADLALVCTEEEMVLAREERSNQLISDLDQQFYTFISNFNGWKHNYSESQTKTDNLLKSFISEQTVMLNWMENLVNKKPSETSGRFSFNYIQKLYDQLTSEANISQKFNWIGLAVLMTNDEVMRRLNKLGSLMKIFDDIDRTFKGCSYQKNKEFSCETSLPLLSFIKPPKVLAPETKCFFVCDVYKELLKCQKKGIVYKYLNPSNVLIISQGQATLRETSKVNTVEPFPPWQFAAPECDGNKYAITSAADCYSFGQFTLWLACVHANRNFAQEMCRIKQACPIFDKIANDDPRQRPDLSAIEQSFATIFPKAFGITYSENYIRAQKAEVRNGADGVPVKILCRQSKTPSPEPIQSKCAEPPKLTKSEMALENMKYELSLLRELQDSDSDAGDLDDDLASMMALSHQ